MTNEIHECRNMQEAEAWIEKQDDCWELYINHAATKADLEESHYLEEVGQTMEMVAISVSHCPYCGTKLDHRKTTVTPDFRYNNFLKC